MIFLHAVSDQFPENPKANELHGPCDLPFGASANEGSTLPAPLPVT